MCFIAENNPVQAMYFSPLIGGEKGAFKNYEMDYWGYSLRPAIEWLDHTDSIHVPGKKLRVRMYYGEQLKLTYYVEKSKNLAYALCLENSTDWDYELMLPCEAKRDPQILFTWPPAGTVYEVKADGVPLCAVVKNPRTAPPSSANSAPLITPGVTVDSGGYNLGLGINAYNSKNYNMAIVYFKKALAFKPDNTLALNNLVATFNNLKMFDDAVYYGKKGLALNPNYELLKNNMAASLNAIKELVPTEAYYQELSYNYFVQGEYLKTIESSKKALALNPNSGAAWNNICSAYNALHQYQKAIDACDRGLKIDAKSDLLKNNRTEAARQLGQH
jgi:tetratricopeptide (TPR) repeat protein